MRLYCHLLGLGAPFHSHFPFPIPVPVAWKYSLIRTGPTFNTKKSVQSLCETPHHLKSARCWSWGRASGIASSGSGYVVEIDSLERPLRLLHDCGEGLYGSKELIPLLPVLDVAGVDVEALHLTEDVLHHYLEAVEASHLWNIDLYNDNALLILRITPSSLSYIFLFFLFLRIEVDGR